MPVGSGLRIAVGRSDSLAADLDLGFIGQEKLRYADIYLSDGLRVDLAGTVVGANGPIPNARVLIGGSPEQRSDRKGQFRFRGVRSGSVQIEVIAIGYVPVSRVINLVGSENVVQIALESQTILDTVHVTETLAIIRQKREFESRRRLGDGYFRDSTALDRYSTLAGAFSGMTAVDVRSRRGGGYAFTVGGCKRRIYVDRVKVDFDVIASLEPKDIAAMEVYKPAHTPTEFRQFAADASCAVIIWTRRGWK